MSLSFKQFLKMKVLFEQVLLEQGVTGASGSGQSLIGTAMGAIMPAQELAASLTGRLSGTGYTEQGALNRFNTYKKITDIIPALTSAGLGGAAAGKLGGMVTGLAQSGGDELATLATAALYDPRAAGALAYKDYEGVTGGIRSP
jgi:hypothetical protein